MATAQLRILSYRRSRFATPLPVDYVYSPSHCWLARQGDGTWRVGLTKFASRMIGEMVDHGFEIKPKSPVKPGQIIGWIEGFKAISDLLCAVDGRFEGSNPILKDRINAINKDCFGLGWLYRVRGEPDSKCLDVHGYVKLLDKTIDKILEKQNEA